VDTAVPLDTLAALNQHLYTVPPDFHLHPKLVKPFQRRREALSSPLPLGEGQGEGVPHAGAGLQGEGRIDWSHAEALAFASILAEGTPIRLTGQDTARGTFSQRHLVLHDVENGRAYTPLQALPQARASFDVWDSPLSEQGPLGFEFGYSVQAPEALVLWEAQYGDFINSGQVIIDTFIATARSKWDQQSSLVLLLPHAYEGQGPEHSSARLERFLQMAAEDNLRVANVTTAAQYFHILRRQAHLVRQYAAVVRRGAGSWQSEAGSRGPQARLARPERDFPPARPEPVEEPALGLSKGRGQQTTASAQTGLPEDGPLTDPRPLVLLAPKSLLRHPLVASPAEELAEGRFQPVLDDPAASRQPDAVRRLVLCSGKVYVDLAATGRLAGGPQAADWLAVARLEELYPFPAEEIAALIDRYPHLEEVVWLQEEPRNMGAWTYVAPRLRDILTRRLPLVYVGRTRRASPAEGVHEWHAREQQRIVAAAFAPQVVSAE
jgi:2-oxoglutarate dehydrogenase complex dehydrogenase (E1) component-like enzyme